MAYGGTIIFRRGSFPLCPSTHAHSYAFDIKTLNVLLKRKKCVLKKYA